MGDRQQIVEVMGDAAGQLPDGLDLERLAQLRLEVVASGQIGEHADEMGQPATGIMHRGDREFVVEGDAVLAVIDHLAAEGPAVMQIGPHARHHGGIGRGPLQEPAVPPDGLADGIARDPLEGGIDIDDGIIGPSGIGDGDGLGDRIQRALAQAQPLLHRLVVGDVLKLADEVEGQVLPVADQGDGDPDPDDPARFVEVALLQFIGARLAGEQPPAMGQTGLEVVGMGDGLEVELLQLERRKADDAGAGLVGFDEASVEGDDGDAVTGVVEGRPEHGAVARRRLLELPDVVASWHFPSPPPCAS